MDRDEPELLALRAAYGSLYNEFIRPEQKYTISHYLRTQWAPLLGAARLWFVVALRQRCYWNERQEWCVVDKKTLARESGLSPRTINRIVAAEGEPQPADQRDRWATWFFSKKRRRRYDRQIGRTVNAPNRYHVLLDDPLTPQHQAGLAHYLREHTAGGGAQETLQALEALCALSDEARRELLDSAPPDADPLIPAAFVLDVVEACCPVPEEGQLKVDIARAAMRLHQAITCPERAYIGTQYFRRQWLPRLGPVSALVVVNLRARCYWNERTGELRDTCRASWIELATEVGCTTRQLRYLRQDEALQRFLTVEGEGHGAARSTFRVQVLDLLTDEDAARFERRLVQWAQAQPGFEADPESGQIDALPLLLQAQAAAGQGRAGTPTPARPLPEILAPGKLGEADSIGQAEILAPGEPVQPTIGTHSDHVEVLAPGRVSAGPAQDREIASPIQLDAARTEVLAPGRPGGDGGSDRGQAPGDGDQSRQAEVLASGAGGQAEVLAPGTEVGPEVLAVGEWKFWLVEGLQAEVLALEGGSFGPTGELLFITLDSKGLATAALALTPTLCAEPERLAAAARHLLLAQLGIEEPNRSRLLRRRPSCAQIMAWGLYALTQRGLQNRAGYVYNRLLAADPAPQDLVDLAGLPPPVWRAFCSAVRERQEHLLPEAAYATYRRWHAVFYPLWGEIAFAIGHGAPSDLEDFVDAGQFQADPDEPEMDVPEGVRISREIARVLARREAEWKAALAAPPPSASVIASEGRKCAPEAKQSPTTADGTEAGEEGGHEAPPLHASVIASEAKQSPTTADGIEDGYGAPSLPSEIGALLEQGETAQWEDDMWVLVTPSLGRACWLYRQVKLCELPVAVRIGVLGVGGQIHLAKAGVLAIPAESIPDGRWAEIAAGLRLRMGHKAFDLWWPEVQPLGLTGGLGHDSPTLLLCAPGQEQCRYLAEHHTDVAEWACASVLHHPLRVLFMAYSEALLKPAVALT